jgi:hypothetical protein
MEQEQPKDEAKPKEALRPTWTGSLDCLPGKLVQEITTYLAHSHPPALGALSRTSRRYRALSLARVNLTIASLPDAQLDPPCFDPNTGAMLLAMASTKRLVWPGVTLTIITTSRAQEVVLDCFEPGVTLEPKRSQGIASAEPHISPDIQGLRAQWYRPDPAKPVHHLCLRSPHLTVTATVGNDTVHIGQGPLAPASASVARGEARWAALYADGLRCPLPRIAHRSPIHHAADMALMDLGARLNRVHPQGPWDVSRPRCPVHPEGPPPNKSGVDRDKPQRQATTRDPHADSPYQE